ncbi:MAG: export ABC transporter ATP-binding protein [Phototrophicales bacterium]|nr:MAG: export ABC transporter ATP-binding protein [Phototrophicales bacterium]RMG75774.1 MAG: ATP-binding cassette domain-containing protein [Chloroflexota bacterium]
MGNAFVEVRNLRKRYGKNGNAPYAVGPKEGINFEIMQGEIFSLLGPNGAGKTTTISIMSTLLSPTEGDVIINGYSVRKQPLAVKEQIGVVPQEIALYPTLTARQNLEFFGRMYGLSGKALRKKADEILEFIDLTDRANERIEKYSGGMKRRVNIGVGLMHNPKMVFLDEPTVGIDPQSRRKILDTVKLLNSEGMTVLYTTHYMEEAQELSDRVGIIDHGQIIALGTIPELTKQVGEKSAVVFHIFSPPEKLIDSIRAIQGVHDVIAQDETIRVISDKEHEIIPSILNIISEMGLSIRSIEVEEPNLEAVFLHLTGRALRD